MPNAKQKEKNLIDNILDNLKIRPKYWGGTNPIGKVQAGHGFFPTKNAALNMGSMMNIPYDPEMRIRKDDPATQLRNMTRSIGLVERIHNSYVPGRVKLAD